MKISNEETMDFQNVIWTHVKSGGRYQVMNFGLREHDLEPCVIYSREGFVGPVFIRTAMEFFDGRFVNTAVDGDLEKEPPMTTTVSIIVDDQMSPKLKDFMAQIREKGLDPAVVSAIVQAEGGQKLSGYNARDEIMTLEAFAETANKFLTEFRSTDGPEYERRKSVIRAICATFEVEKWTEIPALGRDDAVMALNAYKQDMERAKDLHARQNAEADELEKIAAVQKPGREVYVPPLLDRAKDMKGISITPGEMVELASLLSADRADWGAEHYRKVKMVDPDGTVILEGEGNNLWTGDKLIVKSTLDI